MKYFVALFLMSLTIASAALADPVDPAHRVCVKDEDCGLISVGCTLACVGDGHHDAVNVSHLSEYKSLGACTNDEVKRASQIGCLSVENPVAVCDSGRCTVRMQKTH